MSAPTEKLYDDDSYTTRFTAKVLSCVACDSGYAVQLDRTLFFPEEGGQKCDHGTLSGATVSDVQIGEDGVITHITDRPLSKNVDGEIDFARRFRNMQHHSGEHIVSGLIWARFGFSNIGFHLGEDDVTIDTDGFLTREQLDEIEDAANRAVYENLPISVSFPNEEELAVLSYRSKKQLTGRVRIVTIGDYDTCACCAPHVARTGEIGIIKLSDFAKHKNGVRIHLVCGADALRDYREKYRNVHGISLLLAAKQNETALAVEKLFDENRRLSTELGTLRREALLKMIATIAPTHGNLCLFVPESHPDDLRAAVNRLKEKCGGICGAFSGNDENGYFYILASTSTDLRTVTKPVNLALSGRGGGSASMIQGTMRSKEKDIKAYFDV